MTTPYGYLPAPKDLPELHIEPIKPSKMDLEMLEAQGRFANLWWEELRKAFDVRDIFDIRVDERVPSGTIIATDGKTVVRIDSIE